MNNDQNNQNQQQSSPEKARELRDHVQGQVVNLITERVKEGTMSQDRAQKIAGKVLEIMPEDINYDELLRIIPKLDDEFHELSDVVVPIMVEYEKRLHQMIEERVLKLVREKKFKEALIEARKGIEMERNLT